MKKLLSLLLVAFCLTSASCSDKLITESDGKSTQTTTQNQLAASEDEKNKTEEQKALQNESKESNDAKTQKNEPTKAEPTQDKPEPTQTTQVPKAQIQRTVDLSNGISEDGLLFSGSYDFDYDGKAEKISMDVYLAPGDDWVGSYVTVNMGEYSNELEIIGGSIEAVYACDIDPDDGLADLAIITCEVSSDPRVRILKYNEDMEHYSFFNENLNEVENDHWLGYAVSYYFNVNNDGTITLEEQTNSCGMWSVYRTHKRDEHGVFREIKQKEYEILPDFMERNYCIDPLTEARISGKELEMWKKGYIKAYTFYNCNGFTINEGEYFKVIKDDDNNNIYVVKEDGSDGYINTHYETFPGTQLNPYFFYLAG